MIESGSDVRLIEGLAERYALSILARRIEGGVEINHPPKSPVSVIIGPASRLTFAWLVGKQLWQRQRQLDWVIVQGSSLAALAANVAGRLTGTPTVMLICSPVEAYYRCRRENPTPGKPFRLYELWLLNLLAWLNGLFGQQYWVLSEYLAQVVRQHSRGKPVELIPIYGVDTQLFRPPAEAKQRLKAQLGLPVTGRLIFFSSRIAPEKDSETLLAALRQLLDAGRDLWLLHRSGGYRIFLEDAARFGIAARVIATDAVHPHDQLPRDYQASDLCVQASRAEGLGFSPLEALACEIPVVATAVGGLRETIVDGKTGWTYPVGDANALANCIATALDNPDEAARRAAAGRRLIVEKFDRQKSFAQIEQLVRESKATELVSERISQVMKESLYDDK